MTEATPIHGAEQPKFSGVRIFGESAGMVFEPGLSKAKQPCINVEAAVKAGDGYNWGEKYRFQLSAQEIAQLAGVVFGWSEKAQFSRPSNKMFGIKVNEDGTLYLLLSRPKAEGRGFAIQAQAIEGIPLIDLFMQVLGQAYPSLDGLAMRDVIRATCARIARK